MADQYHHGNLKSKLLEEAVTLISQDGLENLSLRRLATQCGVSHNAIYRHFDSKERLIDACRAYVMQELTRTLELTLQRSGTKAFRRPWNSSAPPIWIFTCATRRISARISAMRPRN